MITCVLTSLLDHATNYTFGWSFLLTTQMFALVLAHRPTFSPFITTIIGSIYDILGGMSIGYSACLTLTLQVYLILTRKLFRAIPPLTQSFLISVLLLSLSIPDWVLSSVILQSVMPFMPSLVDKIPMFLSFPFLYFITYNLLRSLISHDTAQS